jgi:RimJ/RimL family protein N-acetyltransferase
MTTSIRVPNLPYVDIEDEPSILSYQCNEPEGSIVRNVRFMTLSRNNLFKFYTKAQNLKTVFSVEHRNDFKKFLSIFISYDNSAGLASHGLFWVVDDFVGVYYLTNILVGQDAKMHYIFFDERHKGRRDLTKEMIKFVFKEYNFHRLTAELPLYVSPSVFKFVESLGFIKEGRKRDATEYCGTWYDVNMYGILRAEALN